jgi:hypothetical protein
MAFGSTPLSAVEELRSWIRVSVLAQTFIQHLLIPTDTSGQDNLQRQEKVAMPAGGRGKSLPLEPEFPVGLAPWGNFDFHRLG